MPVIVDYNQVPASTIPWSQARTPFPLWANLNSMEPIGFSNYEGMQLEAFTVEHRMLRMAARNGVVIVHHAT
jgi:hypothetical protein